MPIVYCLIVLPFLAFCPAIASAGQSFVMRPALEPRTDGITKSVAPLLLDLSASNATEACNEAAHLVGSYLSKPVKVEVCYPSSCRKETVNSSKIVGGSIFELRNRDLFEIGSINHESTDGTVKLCETNLSWDPNRVENMPRAPFAYRRTVDGQTYSYLKGDPNRRPMKANSPSNRSGVSR